MEYRNFNQKNLHGFFFFFVGRGVIEGPGILNCKWYLIIWYISDKGSSYHRKTAFSRILSHIFLMITLWISGLSQAIFRVVHADGILIPKDKTLLI